MNHIDIYREAKDKPTLSELIEACGEGFCCLLRCGEEGYPATYGKYFGTDELMYGDEFGLSTMSHVGKTPEEAVARLFIHLNRDIIDSNGKQKEETNQNM